MSVRPILFSSPMVRAILEGRKTQTRRVLKLQPPQPCSFTGFYTVPGAGGLQCRLQGKSMLYTQLVGYAAGDILWVRESGVLLREAYDSDPVAGDLWQDAGFLHSADGTIVEARNHGTPLADWSGECARVNRPSIHMPRWASRLTLEVTEVRVQRLQEISEEDAQAEGVERGAGLDGRWRDYASEHVNLGWQPSPRESFKTLWNSINEKRGFGWDVNPWVVAVTFKPHVMNVDEFLKSCEAA